MDFSQLFKTVDTVAPGYESGVFTMTHGLVLVSLLVAILLLSIWYRSLDRSGRDRFLWLVGGFGIVNEILKDLYLFGLGEIQWAHLPLHLCGINIIMIGVYLFTRSPKVAEWLYAMSLPGGLVALISPDWAELPVLNIMFWQANTIHACLVLFPILLLIDGFRPQVKRFLSVVPWLFLVALIIYPLNRVLDTNFLFLNFAPIGTPFEVFETWLGNPGYITAFVVLLAITWFIMYWPWRRKDQV